MWGLLGEIINKHFIAITRTKIKTTLSQRYYQGTIRSRHISDKRLLLQIFIFINLFIIATTKSPANDDIIPLSNSWVKKYYRNFESLYLSYGGNPWGKSLPTILNDDQQTHFLWQTEHSRTPRNDSKSMDNTLVIPRIVSSPKRSKRGVVHLYNMVWCATGCNPLAYKGYGCYCGFLGSGFTIDGIDRCCKMHDWCYEATDCPMFMEYFVPYYWKCYRGNKPICAVEHGDWGGSGSCAQRLCECDRALAECLRRYPCPTTKAMCTSSPWRLVQNIFMLL